jgi:hypothetical protein
VAIGTSAKNRNPLNWHRVKHVKQSTKLAKSLKMSMMVVLAVGRQQEQE